MKLLRYGLLFLIFLFLTITTQVGGLVFLLSQYIFRRSRVERIIAFIVLYGTTTFILVPFVAPLFGREKIKITESVDVRMFLTVLANRNYVRPEMNVLLKQVAHNVRQTYPDLKIICLDANFPFYDGFPLLPHLSHNDGKKLDISLVYESEEGILTNDKPSVSGYGIFEESNPEEYNQINECKKQGYWQYDFPKYLTLGSQNKSLVFSEKATKDLVNAIVKQIKVSKVFIEPHLKKRLGLSNPRIRYHGCRAVRHDDHIHLQLK